MKARVMAKKTLTAACFSSGIGSAAFAYRSKGFQILYGSETSDLERSVFAANFPEANHDNTDARWFINRKEKGKAELRAKLGIVADATLDLLDFTTHVTAADKKANTPASLFDFFNIVRNLTPKVAVSYVPPELLANESVERFNRSLDFLRGKKIAPDQLEREYYVFCRIVDASIYGSGVSKSYGVVFAVHKDQAAKIKLGSDEALEFAFPQPQPGARGTVRQSLTNIVSPPRDNDFWVKQTHRSEALWAARKLLRRDPPKVTTLASLGQRAVTDCGYAKSKGDKVLRAAWDSPCPSLDLYKGNKLGDNGCLHPSEDRMFTTAEITALVGMPETFKINGTETEKARLIAQAIPPQIAEVVADAVLAVLAGKLPKTKPATPGELRIRRAETLLAGEGDVRVYVSEQDLGDRVAKGLIGKTPTPKDYDYLFDADVINQDFIVEGPFEPSIGRRPVIGAVRRKVFAGPAHSEAVIAIRAIQETSKARLKESPVPISQKTIENFEKRGVKYRLINNGHGYQSWIQDREGKKGHWDRARTEPISSSTYGWIPDKNTKVPQFAVAGAPSEDLKFAFSKLARQCDSVYYRLASADYKKQERFLISRILREHRLGGSVFTTLAINRYGDDMPAMNYHIDSGDHNSGLTTIAVFNDGEYEGGYFVIPQYRCAFKVGDGDVFVGNSRKVHGVQQIDGEGRRLSVVCYTKTPLAYKENTERAYPPRSERPKFNWNSYKIAVVLSPDGEHPRPIKIFKYLKQQKIDPRRVTLFVSNEQLLELYGKPASQPYEVRLAKKLEELKAKGWKSKRITQWLDKEGYSSLRVIPNEPAKKKGKVLSFGDQISLGDPADYYAPNTPIVYLRDEVEGIYGLTEASKDIVLAVERFEQRVIRRGFDACREHNSYLWGISIKGDPDNEDEALDKSISVKSFHPISSCIGVINRPQLKARYAPNEEATYELGLAHFQKDGRILRFDYLTDALPYLSVPTGKPRKGLAIEDVPPYYVPKPKLSAAKIANRKVLAINGLPATGKSTLMKAFVKGSGKWTSATPAKGLKALYNKQLDCYILGEYVDGEDFPGTDRLDMAIQPVALSFRSKTKSNVIFEGDRLFNSTFLEPLDELGVSLQIIEIVASEEVLKARHKKRKDKQTEVFIKAKRTKIRNICGSPTFFSRVKTMENNTEDDQSAILQEMRKYLGIG